MKIPNNLNDSIAEVTGKKTVSVFFKLRYLSRQTTVSTWPELPLLMSAFLGTGQPFFRVFEVCGNISTVLGFSGTYRQYNIITPTTRFVFGVIVIMTLACL